MFTNASVLQVHDVRGELLPDVRFSHPISDEQYLELAGILVPCLELCSEQPDLFRAGHQAGILLSLTVLERSSELHPSHRT